MSRPLAALVAALAVLAFAFPATASAFSKEDRQILMSDGVKLAATYYVPDGVPPAGGWPAVMLLHGLGGSRTALTPLGMSLNSIAETQLAPQGYAVLTFDARGHGQSEGLVSVDGPREIRMSASSSTGSPRDRASTGSASARSDTRTAAARSGVRRPRACRSRRSSRQSHGPTSTPRSFHRTSPGRAFSSVSGSRSRPGPLRASRRS